MTRALERPRVPMSAVGKVGSGIDGREAEPSKAGFSMVDLGRKQRVFSGIQPTGKIHLGNYLGAVSVWVANQARYANTFCIVDLHALTIPEAIRTVAVWQKAREVAALYIACGLDPECSAIFLQSDIPAHAELTWILNCVTPVGWLERVTQYKAKAALTSSVSAGLLDYPVLQAADILLYRTEVIPVGEDQKQHIELTADIVRRFNQLFGEVFLIPQPLIRSVGGRIMGFDDPSTKMSKSLAETRKGHAIGLTDPPDVIRQTIMEAVTDSGSETRFEHASAGVRNLLTIYEVLSGESRSEIECHYEGKGYRYLKGALADLVIATLTPIRDRYLKLMEDPANLDQMLRRGAEKVAPLANSTLNEVRRAVGIDSSCAKVERTRGR